MEKHGKFRGDSIQQIEQMDGVPLWLWVIISSVTILTIIYAIAIAAFNIGKRADR